MEQLPNIEELQAQMMDGNDDDEEEAAVPDEDTTDRLGFIQTIPQPIANGTTEKIEVSATTPRTKLSLSFYSNGITLTSPKDEKMHLDPSCIKHVIMFPKREDCIKKPKLNKEGTNIIVSGSILLFILNENKVEFRNKALTQICLQLPNHHSCPVDFGDTARPSEQQMTDACLDSFEEKIVTLLKTALGVEKKLYRVYNPKFHNVKNLTCYAFQSDDGGDNRSIMQGQMPYLKCYHGVNDGVIFPMEEGLLFFKPPLFVHRSDLHSIAVGRGGGSRYVDIQAVLDGKDGEQENMEFTNIDREEMQVLNNYIHKTLVPAMAKDANESDDENDDEDMHEVKADPDTLEEENDSSSRKRPRRGAALAARKATKQEMQSTAQTTKNDSDEEDDDDDDGDFDTGHKSESSSDDDDDDDDDDNEDSGSEEEFVSESEHGSDGTVSEED